MFARVIDRNRGHASGPSIERGRVQRSQRNSAFRGEKLSASAPSRALEDVVHEVNRRRTLFGIGDERCCESTTSVVANRRRKEFRMADEMCSERPTCSVQSGRRKVFRIADESIFLIADRRYVPNRRQRVRSEPPAYVVPGTPSHPLTMVTQIRQYSRCGLLVGASICRYQKQ